MKVSSEAMSTVMSSLATQMVEDVSVYPEDGGWTMVALSPDKVSAIRARITPKAFEGYDVEDPFALSVQTTLASLPKGAPWVTMTFTDGRVTFEADGLKFRRALLPPAESRPRMPSLSGLGAEVSTDAWRLLSVMSEGDRKYGTVRLTLDDTGLKADCTDEHGLGALMELTPDLCDTMGGEASSAYPLSAWVPFLRALPKDTMVSLDFGTDTPLIATASVGGAEITWMVAPYIIQG